MTLTQLLRVRVFGNEKLSFEMCLVHDVSLFDCGCLFLFTARVDAHYEI